MKLFLITSFSILYTCIIIAQDKVINLSDFQELSASTSVKIDLVLSSENKAEIDIVKGEIEELKIEESGDRLKIYWKNRSGFNWGNNRQANITLYTNGIDAIDVSAGAKVFSNDVIKSDDFEANVNSGGNLELEFNVGELDIVVNSGGNFKAEGVAETLEINANSGGFFGGYQLEANHVNASADSGGAAKVFASESIKARANSGGSVKFKGNPKNKNIKKDKWSGGMISEH